MLSYVFGFFCAQKDFEWLHSGWGRNGAFSRRDVRTRVDVIVKKKKKICQTGESSRSQCSRSSVCSPHYCLSSGFDARSLASCGSQRSETTTWLFHRGQHTQKKVNQVPKTGWGRWWDAATFARSLAQSRRRQLFIPLGPSGGDKIRHSVSLTSDSSRPHSRWNLQLFALHCRK